MEANSVILGGHKGLKAEILLGLKKTAPQTARELADQHAVSVTAVRRHLKELEAEGLVRHGREWRGQGAPTYAYRLSPGGEALFPKRYKEALTRLLEHVVAREGRSAALEVVQEQYAEMKRMLPLDLGDATPQERIAAVARVLEQAGFMAEADDSSGETRLKVHNCAIDAVASRLPEICQTELTFLEDTLAARVDRQTHIVGGCSACEYAVRFPTPTDDRAAADRSGNDEH
jgi:DeoR family suf operon transcriptional repressor